MSTILDTKKQEKERITKRITKLRHQIALAENCVTEYVNAIPILKKDPGAVHLADVHIEALPKIRELVTIFTARLAIQLQELERLDAWFKTKRTEIANLAIRQS